MYFKVVMELWEEILHKICDSCFCTHEQQICQSYVIITSSLKKTMIAGGMMMSSPSAGNQ